jgi:hypothetical protein
MNTALEELIQKDANDLTPAERVLVQQESEAYFFKHRDQPITMKWLTKALDTVAIAVGKELARLQRRVAALESRPAGGGVSYGGVFDLTKAYTAGTLCTRSGSLWCATRDSIGEAPGNSTAWVLIVKRGNA